MNTTHDDETIELDGNDLMPHTNRAVPPPIPHVGRRNASVRPLSVAVHTVVAYRDTAALSGTLINRHTLTFPPSPPLPRRTRGPFDWKLFLAVVTASSISMASAVGAVWVTQHRPAPPTTHENETLALGAKPPLERTVHPSSTPDVATPRVASRAPQRDITTSRRVARALPAATTAHVASRRADALTPEVPMLAAVEMAEQRARGAVMVCGMGVPNATASVHAIVTYGSDGRPSHVELSSPWAGTSPGHCIEDAVRRRATLPAFAADTYRASYVFQTQ